MQALATEVRRICHEVLQALVGDAPDLPATAAERPRAPVSPEGAPRSGASALVAERSASARLACCVRIGGSFRGQVIVRVSPGLAGLVASRMFGRPVGTPYASEAQEALREMSNIIAGNVRSCLGKHTSLGLPEDLPLDEPGPDVRPMAEVVVEEFGERLEVRIFDV